MAFQWMYSLCLCNRNSVSNKKNVSVQSKVCKVELCLRNGNLNLDKSDVVLQWTDRGTHEN